MSYTHDTQEPAHEPALLHLEKEGGKYSREIAKAVQQVPWLLKSLQLFWTAGPVTYIALQGGYYLGYGKIAPWEIFVYFAGYTLIAGLVGLVATIVYQVIYKPKEIKASKAITKAISHLIDTYALTQDVKLRDLELEYRKLESARLLLENTHAAPNAIRLAISNLTQDKELANSFADIEIYRRAGLQSCISDIKEDIAERAENLIARYQYEHPHIASLIEQRFSGHGPTLREGLQRSEHFLRRLILACEEENEALITPKDIEEILVLVLELLAGREFCALTIKYKGQKRIARAHSNLELARKSYQLALTSCRSRVKALYVHLASLPNSTIEFTPSGIGLEEQVPHIVAGIENLYQSLKGKWQKASSIRALKTPAVLKEHKDYRRVLSLYMKAYAQLKKIRQKKSALSVAMKEWDALCKIMPDTKTAVTLEQGKTGLVVSERLLGLGDAEKIEVAYKILDALDGINLGCQSTSKSLEQLKGLAIELALIISEYVPIDAPVAQYAIESSSATNLLSIEVGTSAKTKVGFLSAMVEEMDDNSDRMVEGFAKALIEQYGISLDSTILGFLGNTYNADLNSLVKMADESKQFNVTPLYLSDWDTSKLQSPPRHWLKLARVLQTKLH